MRLYDRVMADRRAWRDDSWSRRDLWARDEVRSWMEAAAVIDVTNVSAHCIDHGFDEHAIPSYRPPFTNTWFETSKPYIHPMWAGSDVEYDRFGAIAHIHNDGDHVAWFAFVMAGGRVFPHPDNANWDDVMVLTEEDDWKGHSEWGHGYRKEIVQSEAIRGCTPFFMATGLLHCKNVELVDGPMPPPRVQGKQERRLGQPLTAFKELVIDPGKSRKQYTGENNRAERHRDLSAHIVRGHYATYTEDRPRFGRREDGVGTFYIQPHVRGSADVGMVGKDYKVKAPKQEAR